MKLSVFLVALVCVSHAALATADRSRIGDVVQLTCTLPKSRIETADAAQIYSIDARNAVGANLADEVMILPGDPCSMALNTFIAFGNKRLDDISGIDNTRPNCAPDRRRNNQGIWVQAASRPATKFSAAGVAPRLLTVDNRGYAVQQFTFVCMDKKGGGLVNTESD